MEEILKYLNIDNRMILLSLGKLNFLDEFSTKEYYGSIPSDNKNDFPYPPFFIPILIDYNSTPVSEGIIKHWFVNRKLSYGFMEFWKSFEVSEFALKSDQFIDVLAYDEIAAREGKISNSFESVLKELKLEYEYIKKLVKNNDGHDSLNSYDFSNELMNFYEDSGLANYTGDFPSSKELIIPKNLIKSCFCEISHKEWIGYPAKKKSFSLFKEKSKYEPVIDIPEWLRPETDKKGLFEKYLDQNEYGKAWLTINGPGFTPIEVGERVQRLKEFSTEKGYHLWADFWCEKYGEQDSFIFM